MARVQYGSIITGIKGNVGGNTFQNGNTIQIMRNKGYRKGGFSAQRQTQQSYITSNAMRWRTLDQLDRDLWAASAPNWPFVNKFGQTYYGSGYQFYMAANVALMSIGLTGETSPVIPDSAVDYGQILFDEHQHDSITIYWSPAPTVDQTLEVFATAPTSSGQNSNNRKYKRIMYFNMNTIGSINLTTAYYEYFGVPPAGSSITWKFQCRLHQWPIIAFPQITKALVG